MVKLINVVVRFFLYVLVAFPILKGIFGGGFFAGVGAFVVVALVASILEARGIMKRLINALTSAIGISENASIKDTITDTVNGTLTGAEKVVECPNCGSQVSIKGATATCEGCGTLLSK